MGTVGRAVVTVATMLGCGVALLVAAPLIVVAVPITRLPAAPARLRRPAHLVLLGAAYLVLFEVPALVTTVRPTGPRRHGRFGWINSLFVRRGFRFAGLTLRHGTPAPVPAPGRPVIVLSRHAGAFNSYLVWYLITDRLGRNPCTVAKPLPVLTPGLRRVAAGDGVRFIARGPDAALSMLDTLRRMADRATPTDALLLYPEGANFTARRRRAALRAHPDAAVPAHLLPPMPAGARALCRGQPDADVLILAHTGLEDLLPVGAAGPAAGTGTVHVAWWRFPAAEVPRGARSFAGWLEDRWRDADAWTHRIRYHPARSVSAPADRQWPERGAAATDPAVRRTGG